MSLASTQIKKSKTLLTQIQSYIAKDSNGQSFTPPSFAHIFRATTVGESNDQGNWEGWRFERVGYVEDANLFEQAKTFYELSNKGNVKVDYNASPEAGPSREARDDDNDGM